jgi:hypothetical protein
MGIKEIFLTEIPGTQRMSICPKCGSHVKVIWRYEGGFYERFILRKKAIICGNCNARLQIPKRVSKALSICAYLLFLCCLIGYLTKSVILGRVMVISIFVILPVEFIIYYLLLNKVDKLEIKED